MSIFKEILKVIEELDKPIEIKESNLNKKIKEIKYRNYKYNKESSEKEKIQKKITPELEENSSNSELIQKKEFIAKKEEIIKINKVDGFDRKSNMKKGKLVNLSKNKPHNIAKKLFNSFENETTLENKAIDLKRKEHVDNLSKDNVYSESRDKNKVGRFEINLKSKKDMKKAFIYNTIFNTKFD